MTKKPLFIPLTSKWFAEFEAGRKPFELRPYGPRWNERTCPPGRAVTLSRGYGKAHRLQGEVTRFEKIEGYDHLPEPARSQYLEVYGSRPGPIAMIRISIKDAAQPVG